MSELENLRGGIVVSVQADDGSPMRSTQHIVAMSKAALAGGACGLRLRLEDIAAVRSITTVPIIGLTKQSHRGSDVYITSSPKEIQDVANAGADIIAFDGTLRQRPFSLPDLIAAVRATGKKSMADISTFEEAVHAYECGADIVGTTMSGYTPSSPKQSSPDFELMLKLQAHNLPFIAEGRINSPELATRAMKIGAHCVVVGSAITRPDHITRWFADAVRGG